MSTRTRVSAEFATRLDLPPPYNLVSLREVGDAFAHATAHAATLGAGALVHVGRFDLAEFAVVLEPAEPLWQARGALYAGLNALADALAVHAPPERPITFDWPDAIRVDGGLVGGVRLAWPDNADEDATPDWLVFGAMIRTISLSADESGLRPLSSALDAEGFDEQASDRIVESFSRHLMVAVDAWQEKGFPAIARDYLARLAPEPGVRRDIADNGDLLVRRMGKADHARHKLVPALAVPRWLDPATRGPRA